MNRRIWSAGSLLFAAVVVGCASGGGGSGGPAIGAAPQPIDESNLPSWAQNLPPGIEPRENDQTAAATLAIFQAENSSGTTRTQRWEEALAAAQAGIALDPENPQSHLQAGRAYLALGDFAAADQSFTRAEELYPRYAVDTEYYREEGWIREYNAAIPLLTTNPAQAMEHLERADQIYRWRPEAMMQLGQLYMDMNRNEDAIDPFVRAAEVIASPRAREIRDAETLAEWDEYREIAMYNAGDLLFLAERYAEAASLYEDLVAEHPDDLAATVNLGIALVSAGQVDRATQILQGAMSRPGITPRELANIGSGLERANQLELAAQAFGRAHQLMPMDQESLFYQVQSLYFAADELRLAGDTARANPLYRQVVDLADDLLALDTHGQNSYTYYFNALLFTRQEQAANDVFNRLQELPFLFEGWNMAPVENGWAIAAQAINQGGAAPGTQVRVRVHFYDGAGTLAGSRETAVTLGGPNEAAPFQVNLDTQADVMGYRYEVLN